MLFNSIDFVIFFVVFFILYWHIFNRTLKLQNLLVLIGSYTFYAWWDWHFLFLLIGSSLVTYLIGISIYKSKNEKFHKLLFWIGIIQGLGSLFYFKYFNFFIESFTYAFSMFNTSINTHALNIILPLGISFYTFRTLSYLFDINNGKIKPTSDWIIFFSYVAFFPSLISGPIDRVQSLIPQLEKKRTFDRYQAFDGLKQILWGLFKKIVIANNCAVLANNIFEEYQLLSGSTLLIGAFSYVIQVYADFSGYTDMAIGFSRLLGFSIAKNFDCPYFALNIAEFWRKWHISLTSWLTDYVFTPLRFALRDYGKLGLIIAIIINMVICGVWHGANWTYIVFGLIHGLYFIPLIIRGTIFKKREIKKGKLIPSFIELRSMLLTFSMVIFADIFFRSDNISMAFDYINGILSKSLFTIPKLLTNSKITLVLVFLFMIIEWFGKDEEYSLAKIGVRFPKPLRWAVYYSVMILILFFIDREQQPFIYFKF